MSRDFVAPTPSRKSVATVRRVRYGQILPAILVAALGVPACYSPQSVDWLGPGSDAQNTTNELQPKTPLAAPGNMPVGDDPSKPPEPPDPSGDDAPAPTLSALPAACNGLPYEASLSAAGPDGPYALKLLDNGGEFTLGADGVLSGVPRGVGTRAIVVAITDGKGKVQQSSLELRVRERCWLAYSSRESGALRLHVTDVLATTSKVFPAASSEEAFDFAFSPSGRHLAYRAGVDADSASLYVLRPESDVAARLPFELPVAAYAWSRSGEHLAVILAAGGDQWFVSGLAVPADAGAAALAEAVPWPLVPTSYRRELHWMGETATVHLGRYSGDSAEEPERIEMPYVSRRLVSDLSPSRALDALPMPADDGALYAMAGGFIALNSQTVPGGSTFEAYFPSEAGAYETDRRATLWDDSTPSDLWWSDDRVHAGRVDGEGRFVIHAVAEGNAPRAISQSRCGHVLAWRTLADRERVVCADAGGCALDPEYSVLRVFDFLPASNSLDERALDGCWQTRVATDEPRAISRAGSWLVYDTGETLATIPLTGAARTPAINLLAPAQPHQRAYAISPDEAALLVQSGPTLWWRSPIEGEPRELTRGRDPTGQAVSLSVSQPTPCEPRFVLSPERWCGYGALEPRARWSADSLSIVFRTDDGALWSADVSHRSAPAVLRRLSVEGAVCVNGCIEGFALQP